MLALLSDHQLGRDLAARGVTAVSLDGPAPDPEPSAGDGRADLAGQRRGIPQRALAAETFGRYLPMMVTAAGTARPAEVLVLGAGVAGLQAIGTARRLGASVRAFDVRPDARRPRSRRWARRSSTSPRSSSAAGEGGYARALTEAEQARWSPSWPTHVVRHDIVITTAQVPGRTPPLLVSADAVAGHATRLGRGGRREQPARRQRGQRRSPGETIVTDGGVTVIGADDLPSTMPTSASNAYSPQRLRRCCCTCSSRAAWSSTSTMRSRPAWS